MASATCALRTYDLRMAGIELVQDKVTRVPFAPEKKVTNRLLGSAVRKGLFFYPASGMAGKAGGDAMMITPPFTIGDAEIKYIIRIARTDTLAGYGFIFLVETAVYTLHNVAHLVEYGEPEVDVKPAILRD